MPSLDDLNRIIEKTSLTLYGWAPLEKPLTLSYYKSWLNNKHHGHMKYLEDHLPQKENPQQLMKRGKWCLVVAHNYVPHPEPWLEKTHLKIARYARGTDYHFWLKRKLEEIIVEFKNYFPNEEFITFVDSAPVMERDLAYRAGLGWIGKNTCLINEKKGSLFVLGEIYTSLDVLSLKSDEKSLSLSAAPDRCGTCTRCIDVCPTQALEPRKLDATRCISYWTIEAKDPPPETLRNSFKGWYFGCDLCQTVCPWNQKVFGVLDENQGADPHILKDLEQEIENILSSSNKQIEKRWKGTALSRASGNKHKSNALLLCAEYRLKKLKPLVEKLTKDPKVGQLACWVLSEIDR